MITWRIVLVDSIQNRALVAIKNRRGKVCGSIKWVPLRVVRQQRVVFDFRPIRITKHQ